MRLSEPYVLFDLLLPFQYLTFSAFYDLISCTSLWREVGCRSMTQTTTAIKAVSVSETTCSAEFYSPVCIVSSGPFKPLWTILKHTCFIIAFSDWKSNFFISIVRCYVVMCKTIVFLRPAHLLAAFYNWPWFTLTHIYLCCILFHCSFPKWFIIAKIKHILISNNIKSSGSWTSNRC